MLMNEKLRNSTIKYALSNDKLLVSLDLEEEHLLTQRLSRKERGERKGRQDFLLNQ